jgi:hypothetical protein
MSALFNNLNSTAFFSPESFPEQVYLSQTFTETSRCSGPGILQNNFFSTIRTSMSSISEFVYTEDDLSPYICCRDSGALDFWDEPGEDIYTLEDGQPLE